MGHRSRQSRWQSYVLNDILMTVIILFSVASKKSAEEECLTEVEPSIECLGYVAKLNELEKLVQNNQPFLSSMQKMASELQEIKLAAPSSSAGSNSPGLQAALDNAKAVTEEKGISSPEAKVAWDTVEEIAAAGSHNAEGGQLTVDECLVDAAKEACVALEEFNKVLERARAEASD